VEVLEMPPPIERPPTSRRRLAEAARLLRFAVVGIAATATHHAIALVLVAAAGLPAPLAHLSGFRGAVPVSFLGHCRWTFRSRDPAGGKPGGSSPSRSAPSSSAWRRSTL